MTGYAFRRYGQFETSPEAIENCDLQFANGDRFKANYSVDASSVNMFKNKIYKYLVKARYI